MFEETGCVPGSDGEEVPAETMVPDAKKYILETINDPEAFYDPEIWDTPGFTLVLSWLAQKWQQKCRKLAPRGGNKNAIQYLTKEQQKACLDSAVDCDSSLWLDVGGLDHRSPFLDLALDELPEIFGRPPLRCDQHIA